MSYKILGINMLSHSVGLLFCRKATQSPQINAETLERATNESIISKQILKGDEKEREWINSKGPHSTPMINLKEADSTSFL